MIGALQHLGLIVLHECLDFIFEPVPKVVEEVVLEQ